MKNVIAGLEEGLQAIAEALESGGGGNVPTPTLDDDGKVLRVVSQSQEEVAPEWSDSREVPRGGQNGQVLTRTSEGYGWAAPSGGLPALYEEDNGKVLMAQYDSDTENTYPAWSIVKQVPAGGTTGQVLTRTSGSGYGWATPSGGGGGGGNVDTVRLSIPLSSFVAQTHMNKSMYVASNVQANLISLSLNSKLISISASPYNPMSECYNLPMDFAYVSPGIGTADIGIPAEAYTFASGLEGVDTLNVYITYYTGQ